MSRPFVIVGTPRSRTTWLSQLLTFEGWECLHEPSLGFRSLEDLKALLDRPNTGSADALMTFLWRDILTFRPDTRFVVVRRPIPDVLRSFARLGPVPAGSKEIAEAIEAQAKLITELPGSIEVSFETLGNPRTVQRLVKHAIGHTIPEGRLSEFQARRIQCSIAAKEAQVEANREGFARVYGPHLSRVLDTQVPRKVVVVVNRPDYRIALEDLFEKTFGHIEFTKATPGSLRAARADIDAVMAMHGGPIYAMSGLLIEPAEVRKHAKFMALMGFTPTGNFPCIDGVDRPLYLREQ